MKLAPHQIEDGNFLASRFAKLTGNFSGMGSGKTLTDLYAKKLLGDGRHLVIAPPIALNMWQRESAAFLQLPAEILLTGRSKLPDFRVGTVIASYNIMTTRREELCDGLFDTVTFDEGHALKTPTALRTQAALGYKKPSIADNVDYAWDLTGTPMTRHNDDVYAFLCRAAPEELRSKIGRLSLRRFWLRYCIVQNKVLPGTRRPIQTVVGSRNTEELNALLYVGAARCAVRRELEEVWKDIPPLTITDYTAKMELDSELKALLRKTNKMTMQELDSGIRGSDTTDENNLASLRRKIGMAKVRSVAGAVGDQLDNGDGPVLIGAWHTSVIDALEQELHNNARPDRPLTIAVLDGRTPNKKKSQIEDDWNAGNIDAIIGQIAAMGVSLNLQKGGANKIAVIEEDWSPTIMDQFYARLRRKGQVHSVGVIRYSGGTKLEQAITRLSAGKARNAARLHAAVEDV